MDEFTSEILTAEELERCKEVFDAFNKNANEGIEQSDLSTILKLLSNNPDEDEIFRIITEIDDDNSNPIKWKYFKQIIEEQKHGFDLDEKEMIDAFVAMGGNPDKSGFIDAERLIQVIKEDFGMTIDIEKMIANTDEDGSGQIEYGEFKSLLNPSCKKI